jgi:hypothetical protein
MLSDGDHYLTSFMTDNRRTAIVQATIRGAAWLAVDEIVSE